MIVPPTVRNPQQTWLASAIRGVTARGISWQILLVILGLQLQGCTSDAGRAPSYVSRDSSGIQIVESVGPRWPEGGAWRVDPVPTLDLSERADSGLYRLGAARLLPGGHLGIYNGGSCEVRIYDGDLTHLTSFGRCGDGPGEFSRFRGLWGLPGDSLLVVDRVPPRLTIFTSNGTLSRTAVGPRSDQIPLPFVVGVFQDGTFVLRGARNPSGRSSPGIDRDELVLALAETDSAEPLVVGSFPGAVWEYTDMGGGALGRRLLTFSSSTEVATGASHIYVGFPDRYEIRRYGANGVLEMVLRRDAQRREVTTSDLDWLMERRLAEVADPEGQRLIRQAFRDLAHADAMPAFGIPIWPDGRAEGGPSLLADDIGNLWVFEHYGPGEYANRWSVFSQDGVWLGIVSLPDHLMPTQIGGDFVLGHWRDETGFVHVRQHRLVKP